MEEECKKNPKICGDIWHNQGVCFAGMFLYEEAKECFLTAYKYHRNMESVYHALAACSYLLDEEGAAAIRQQYDISEVTYTELTKKWQETLENEEMAAFHEQMAGFFENDWHTLLTQSEFLQLIDDWKKEYQKNCR